MLTMKTFKRHAGLLFLMLSLSFGTAIAQNQKAQSGKETEQPVITTLKEYTAYVKKVDVKKLSDREKLWLEEQYNKIVDGIDRTFHLTSREDSGKNHTTSSTSKTSKKVMVAMNY